MTKTDWIKLAMPASITLLAAAIFSAPMLALAQFPREISVTQAGNTDGFWKVVQIEPCNDQCADINPE